MKEGKEVKQSRELVNRQIEIRSFDKNKRQVNGKEIIMKHLTINKYLTIVVMALWMLTIPMAGLASAKTAYVLGTFDACPGGLCGTEFGLVKHVIGGDSTFIGFDWGYEMDEGYFHAMDQYRGVYSSGAVGLQIVVVATPYPNHGYHDPIEVRKYSAGNFFDYLDSSVDLNEDDTFTFEKVYLEVDQSKKLVYVLFDSNRLFVFDADTLEKLTDEPITLDGIYASTPADIALDEENEQLWVAIGRTAKAYNTNTWDWVKTVVFDSLGRGANANAIAVDGKNGYVWAVVENYPESVLCREDINSEYEETFYYTLCADKATHLAVDPNTPAVLYGLMEGGEFWRIHGAEVDEQPSYPSCDWIEDLGGPGLYTQIDMFIEKPLYIDSGMYIDPFHELAEDPFQYAYPNDYPLHRRIEDPNVINTLQK